MTLGFSQSTIKVPSDQAVAARRGSTMLFAVGALSVFGGLLILAASGALRREDPDLAGLLVPIGVFGLVIGALQLVTGFFVRRYAIWAMYLGIALGVLGVALAAFDVVSVLIQGGELTTIAMPFIRVALNFRVIYELVHAVPLFSAAPTTSGLQQPPAATGAPPPGGTSAT